MPVSSVCPEYNDIKCKWDLVRSIVNNDAQKWIRIVDSNDPLRSRQYKADAILTNFTRQTKTGLTGLIFRKPALAVLPTGIEYILHDATGYGFNLDQFAQQIVGEVLQTGRYGLLIDCPDKGDGAQGLTRFRPYAAEAIINWRYEEFGSEYKPVLIVLKETIEVVTDDIFAPERQDQYRVLMMTPDGAYQQVLYNRDLKLVSSTIPLDYNGNPFTEIPFIFVGSENNDSTMDSIPLYDLSVVNLGHYRNSADLEESLFIIGQPFLVVNVGETSQEDFRQANPNGLQFGSRGGLILQGGEARLLQANANQLVSQEMKRKEEQAFQLGARLIIPAVGRETAEAARIRYGAQNSALYVVVQNISQAIEDGLNFISRFETESPTESVYKLNDQFYDDYADATVIAQELLLFDRGLMTSDEVRDNLKNVGILPPDSETPDPSVLDPLQGAEHVDMEGVDITTTPPESVIVGQVGGGIAQS